jgi:hypothetical protein
LFGYAIKPPSIREIELANKKYGVGAYGPVYRSGGLVGLAVKHIFGREAIVLGRNILMMTRKRKIFLHETAHYYQQLVGGHTTFYGRLGVEAIRYGPHGMYKQPGTLEYMARWFAGELPPW